MSAPTPPRTSRLAVTSLVLGLLILPFLVLTGVPAILLGLRGLREINASDGRVRGRGLALAGMALGALGCVATAVGIGAIIVLNVNEKSRFAQCKFNLGQVGMAVNRYHDLHDDHFTRAAVADTDLAPPRRVSWMAVIMAQLEAGGKATKVWQNLAGKIDYHKAWDDPANGAARRTNVGPFFCPAQTAYNPHNQPGRTTYVGLAGIDPDAPLLPKTSPRAGFFGYDRVLSRKDITAGISFTLMVTETARDNGPWIAAGEPTLRSLAPDEENYIGPGRPFGGLHAEGLNALYVDGSVRTLSNNTPAKQFRDLVTINHGPGR